MHIMSGLQLITESLEKHPRCVHGPTLLFSRSVKGVQRNFFACSCCRDRKLCPFFLYEDEKHTYKSEIWELKQRKFVENINHRRLFVTLNEIRQLPPSARFYCHTCNRFQVEKFQNRHKDHNFVQGISDYQLSHPTELLPPLEDAKKEAQFLFSQTSVQFIVDILKNLKFGKVLCIGTPRIHEFITYQCPEMSSLLLDIDDRFHNFYGPLEFCWYNAFNNHFFSLDSEDICNTFLNCNSKDIAVILDPPFGGRVEPLTHTIRMINKKFKELHENADDLAIFWVFPYFMEPQIINSAPEFVMLDYKVDYDNHPLFQQGKKGRKFGSPVRIFTNVDASKIILPVEEGYKFCQECNRYVSSENRHCIECKSCSSKDGRTYMHCRKCQRCVKPSWQHCQKCNRCSQPDHHCENLIFSQNCFHCKQTGHKKRDCPEIDRHKLHEKRKLEATKGAKKKRKLNNVNKSS